MKVINLMRLLIEQELDQEVVVCVDNFYVPAYKVETRVGPKGNKQVVIK